METTIASIETEHKALINQVLNFENSIHINRPATLKDGIKKINKRARRRYVKKFKKRAIEKKLCNFIPASGSGSRMFKEVISFCKNYNVAEESFSLYVNRTKDYKLKDFLIHLKKFPFYNYIPQTILHPEHDYSSNDKKKLSIAKYLIEEAKIHCQPKALQMFHQFDNNISNTALQSQYFFHQLLASAFGEYDMHLTINENFKNEFSSELSNYIKDNFPVSFSVQSKETDAYCLNNYNNMFTTNSGDFLKKPAGHGALIENLDAIKADCLYLHNIDNIPHPHTHEKLAKESKVALGFLSFLEEKIHKYLTLLEKGKLDKQNYKRFKKFCKNHLHIDFKSHLQNSSEGKMSTIYHLLNRPIRVCAMVPDTNQKGGGPFWVNETDGTTSLQIVESVEMNSDWDIQVEQQPTHFNPVAVYCSLKNYKGEPFNLFHFSKEERKFLVHKSYNGKDIKYFESAGLWNGAMHNWTTMFIEMKGKYFNPVKSIVDVLNNGHIKGSK
tara:strand:+ start:6123 stop:7616 length:1494 start_codon:yes stop_codon:yes gene_type:complete